MKKSLVISEHDSIAAILENDRVVEFFVNRGELLLGDIYSATVDNILPGIDAAFVNLGKDKMGFLHANDVPGQGPLKERLVPKQKLLVQITKEPTGHKGPRVSTAISLPGRFLVLVPEERGVSISRRISEARERARLKSVVNLMKPPGVGLIIRTEAKGQGENELFEDFEQLWDRWQTVVSEGEGSIGPTLIYRDQDLLYRVIRDAYSNDVSEIICDTADGQRRAQEYLQGWAGRTTKVMYHSGDDNLLVSKGVDKEIEAALSDRVEMPSGGHLNIQPTEALTVIDVNSGRFTSSRTQAETVRRTNLEAAQEIARQLRLRNIGGMVIVDFIDMDSRKDQQQVLEVFQRVLEEDRAKPQCGQLSDLGLVELTRRRQGQSLRELFTVHCNSCGGLGVIPTLEIGSRVITFKAREEEKRGANRRPLRQQGTVLRAATAHNGRIMPTMDEEIGEGFEDVPEDILDQMPDDLLHDPSRRELKGSTNRGFNDLEGEDEEGDELSFEVQQQQSKITSAQKRTLFEETFSDEDDEEEDPKLSADLVENISAVNEVYEDMGTRSRGSFPPAEHELGQETTEVTPALAAAVAAVVTAAIELVQEESAEPLVVVETQVEQEAEEELVSFASSSPFQTEYDPVTGVYRLKARSTEPEGSSRSGDHQHTASESHESYAHRQEAAVDAAPVEHHQQGEQLNLFAGGSSQETQHENQSAPVFEHHGNDHGAAQERPSDNVPLEQHHTTHGATEHEQVHTHDHSDEHGHEHSHDHSHDHGHEQAHEQGHEQVHVQVQEQEHFGNEENSETEKDHSETTEQETYSGFRDQ